MNTTIKLRCIDQALTFESTPELASGGQGTNSVQISFCDKWDGMTKVAVFWRTEDEVYHVLLDDKTGEGVIPWEVLTEEGAFFISVFGTAEDGRRRPCTPLRYPVKKGPVLDGALPSDPTPSIYEQILTREAHLQESVDGVVGAANAAATAAKAAEDAAIAAAELAENAAAAAAAEAVELVRETLGEAVDTAQAASDTAAQAAETAQQAVERAETAAEEAAESAKKEVLGMGAVLYSFGSYTGTGDRRVITLPVTPKLVHIWGEPSTDTTGSVTLYTGASPAITLGQGESLVRSAPGTKNNGTSACAGFQRITLEGNTLVFDWNVQSLADVNHVTSYSVDHLNQEGSKYSIAIVYAPGDEVDNTVQLTVVNELGNLAEHQNFYVTVGEMTYKIDTVLRLQKGTKVSTLVQDIVDGCSLFYNGHWVSQVGEHGYYIRISHNDGVQLCYTAEQHGDFSGVLAGKRAVEGTDTLPQSLVTSTIYNLRILKDDDLLYIKVWIDGSSEPSSWDCIHRGATVGAPVGDDSDEAWNWGFRIYFNAEQSSSDLATIYRLDFNGAEDVLASRDKAATMFDLSASGLTWDGSTVQMSGMDTSVTSLARLNGNYEARIKFHLNGVGLPDTDYERKKGLYIQPFRYTTNPNVTGGQAIHSLLLEEDATITLHGDGFGGIRLDVSDD